MVDPLTWEIRRQNTSRIMTLMSFAEALEESSGASCHLLLGNGFSIAQGGARFHYAALLDHSGLPEHGEIRNVFHVLGTLDFEEVMRALEHAAIIEAAYGDQARSDRFNGDAALVRNA